MVNVYDYAHNLARALKECPENKAFQAARAKIKGKPAAEQMVADFHKKQLELQSQALQGKEPTEEQKEGLQRLYNIIQTDPDVREYLMAEQRLAVLLQDIQKIIADAIEADIPLK
ncbi:MAG TPA: YlbF family regulator [Symbiobacteriaceae bacterium]